ncbi:hypothetical protein [Lignipirellula cremea]|uniref:Cadherin domain-containing protein n=1 Tax=Lignipirellula cremea TaxID=2528010 RepID=A0A518E558_9BACT|nr:hypothetical protein [Lignipirellula cremea]QDU99224.1 hypothetical protein Pla8534_71370 [Lignipirellula cremea]
MNRREKILAGAVGLMLVAGAAFMLWPKSNGGFFAVRVGKIKRLERDISELKKGIVAGRLAGQKLTDYRERSLPGDRDKARFEYQRWLFDIVERESGLDQVVIKPGGESERKGVYRRYTFAVAGQGRLEKVATLLHHFYQVDWLHRVTMLRLQPMKNSKEIKLTMTIEALALPGAPESAAPPVDPSRGQMEDYLEPILARNLFGRRNRSPQLARVSSTRGETKKSLSFSAAAKDADPLDTITYLLEQAPEGARLTVAEGQARISWTPPAPGEYEFTLAAADDGLPVEVDRQTVKIVVADPPPPRPTPPPPKPTPPKPAFDTAEHTVLTTIVRGGDGRQQIWLLERTSDKLVKCYEGDAFEFGSVAGVVESIHPKEIVFQASDRRFLLGVGETLANAEMLPIGL